MLASHPEPTASPNLAGLGADLIRRARLAVAVHMGVAASDPVPASGPPGHVRPLPRPYAVGYGLSLLRGSNTSAPSAASPPEARP